jgi:hypothetical protein
MKTNGNIMKLNKTFMALLLSGAVGSTSALAATPQPGIEHHGQAGQQPYGERQQQSQYGQSQQQMGMDQVKIVEKDKLDKQLTANDLIGKEVYTSDNEAIGQVENLQLQGGLFSQMEREFVRDQDDQQENREWRDQVRERQDVTGIGSPGLRDPAGTYGQQAQQVQVMAIIEMENDKLLSVPVSQLRYNAEEERFEVTLTQSQLDQLQERAEQQTDDEN